MAPTPFRDRGCRSFDVLPTLNDGAVTQTLLENDDSTPLSFSFSNVGGMALRGSILNDPVNRFRVVQPSQGNQGAVVTFTVFSNGNLSTSESDTITVTLQISNDAAVCRPVGQPLSYGPCTVTVIIVVTIARLHCPNSEYIILEEGQNSAVVTFASAEPNTAYNLILQSVLQAAPFVVTSDVANNTRLGLGSHTVSVCIN